MIRKEKQSQHPSRTTLNNVEGCEYLIFFSSVSFSCLSTSHGHCLGLVSTLFILLFWLTVLIFSFLSITVSLRHWNPRWECKKGWGLQGEDTEASPVQSRADKSYVARTDPDWWEIRASRDLPDFAFWASDGSDGVPYDSNSWDPGSQWWSALLMHTLHPAYKHRNFLCRRSPFI